MSTLPAPTHAEPVARERPASALLLRLALCVALTMLNAVVVVKFAGHALEQAGVTLLFAALLGSLAHTWFLTLFHRSR